MKQLFCLSVSLLVLALYLSSPAQSEALDLNLNDDAVRLSYAWPAKGEKLQLDAGLLHHQDRGELGHFGLHLVDLAAPGKQLKAGLGGKLFYANADGPGDDLFNLGLGGFVHYTFPNSNRFSVSGHGYFAPDILAFGDADTFVEFEARLSYNVLRDGDIYLGARYINIELRPGGDVTLDNGLHAGIQLRF